MAIKPILFNGAMVRTILDGRKTVTRRVVKQKYSNTELKMRTDKYGTRLIEIEKEVEGVTYGTKPDGTHFQKLLAYVEPKSPYQPGDILYVRETWGDYQECTEEGCGYYLYRADYPDGATSAIYGDGTVFDLPKWHPSIHMPKEAARIWLRVTDVRVEQLKDITEDGAKEDGFSSRDEFIINFLKIYPSCTLDSWIWIIQFTKIEKPCFKE